MRKEFVSCETLAEAYAVCPWAAVCIECDGGHQCFESSTDADIWLNQA